jgi:hypothetical protein
VKTRHLLLCSTLVLLSAQLPHGSAQNPPPPPLDGTVASVTGDWQQDGKGIHFGDSLRENSCVLGSSGSLVVWWRGQLVPHTCKAPAWNEECGPAVTTRCAIKMTTSTLNALDVTQTRFWAAAAPLIHQSPLRYFFAASRGGGYRLTDAVVQLTTAQLDVSPAFETLPPGMYRVRLTPLAISPAPAHPLSVAWTHARTAFVPGTGISPGLYALSLVEENVKSDDDAWILASSSDRYPTLSAAFREAVKVTSQWPEEVQPEATRAVLRAYLESLSQSNKGATPP